MLWKKNGLNLSEMDHNFSVVQPIVQSLFKVHKWGWKGIIIAWVMCSWSVKEYMSVRHVKNCMLWCLCITYIIIIHLQYMYSCMCVYMYARACMYLCMYVLFFNFWMFCTYVWMMQCMNLYSLLCVCDFIYICVYECSVYVCVFCVFKYVRTYTEHCVGKVIFLTHFTSV